MPRIPGVRRTFHQPGRPADLDVDDEFRFHLEMRTRELIDEGWTPDAARVEALRLFGDLNDARTYCQQLGKRRERRLMRTEMLDGASQDLTFAIRSLRRAPGFALAAVLTLALGVGANITMFGIVDRLLFRPPAHVIAPELVRRLYFTRITEGNEQTQAQMSYAQYVTVAKSMSGVAAVGAFYGTEMVVGAPDEARRSRVTLASASFLPALGVRPHLGRFFTAEEDNPPAGSRVVVIGYHLWRGEHGSDPAVIGRTLTIAGQRFEIIGVAPAGFTGVDPVRADAWVPMTSLGEQLVGKYSDTPWHQTPKVSWLRAIARVGTESAIPQAERLATAGFRQSIEAGWSAARADSARPRAALEPLLLERGPDRTPTARIAIWLAGMSLLVLLIACANVANLMLARALRRQREMAVRMALGAGRARLVGHLLIEGMVIALLGGAAALVVAQTGGQLVRSVLIPDVAWDGALFDLRMLVVAAAAVIGTGMLIGLVPALQASDMNLVGSLKTGGREGGGRRSITRSGLVVVQAALSLVLLVGSGLFLRSLHKARSVELGFAADRVLAVDLDLTGAGYSTEEGMALYDQLYARAARLAGVEQASLAFTEPFATTINYGISIPGRDSVQLPPSGPPHMNAVTPEFFMTMGTRLVAGRAFSAADRRGAPMVGIINETMARTLWPGRSPLGERFCIPSLEAKPCFAIIGVAPDARWTSLSDEPTMQMYFPLEQQPSSVPLRVLLLRTSGDPTPVIRAIRNEVRAIAPRVRFADVDLLAGNIEPQMRPWRLGATVFTLFGVLALVLAGLGLYSVIAYDVAQRTREVAVRMALGAERRDVLRLIVSQGVQLAGIGIVAGVALALASGPWIGPLLFDTAPSDPLVLAAVSLTLFGVALAASAIPAVRATRVAPGSALRGE